MNQHLSSSVVVLMLVLLLPTLVVGQQEEHPFYFGVDLSYVNEMEDCGAVYRENGEARDPFELFAAHGAMLVRARLWHSPDWTEYSTLDDVQRTFARARDAGMATLLDIHYSDNWADAGTQAIPAAWTDMTDHELVDVVYTYTIEVLRALDEEDLTPSFVQVGNETNSGILKRGSDQNWTREAQLFNAGIRAIRDFSASTNHDIKILLHVAQPENTGWWFTEAEAAGVTDFDVIGVSFYPQWSTFSISDMGAQVTYLRQRFGKDVMVLETGYAWTRDAVDESADNILDQGLRGYPFSPEGQRRFMTDLTQALISNGALGIVYWEPAWVSTECSTRWGQGSHWENATFFDFQNGNELLEGINFLQADYLYPDILIDGIIEGTYGASLVEDSTNDSFDDDFALDLSDLYVRADETTLFLAAVISGELFTNRGSYLFYFDTTHDEQGAEVDVGRRPITVVDPFKPELRFDIKITDERGTIRGSYTLNIWVEGDWEEITFTGGAALVNSIPSIIELQMPLALLGNPEMLNIALISTGRGRAQTASDILGTTFTPAHDEAALVLEQFFQVELVN
jgi:arabinogalactan endo-1,4-beta-galactosidase